MLAHSCLRVIATCVSCALWCAVRDGWRALLGDLGFTDVAVAGEAAAHARLLSRQSVVLGVSDGVIAPQTQRHQIARLQEMMPPLPPSSVEQFRCLRRLDCHMPLMIGHVFVLA